MEKFGLYPIDGKFSQYGQATVIRDVLCRHKGFYVDVGARCGRVISNTLELEQEGWNGICVEPHPQLFEKLQAQRTCQLFNCGVSDRKDTMKFVMFLEEPFGNSGLLDSFRNPDRLANVKHEIIEVKVRPLTDILEEANAPEIIDYLDIDVEGHELAVLNGINFSKHRFNFLGVETNPKQAAFGEISELLAKHGYKPFLKIGSDTIFTPLMANG